MGNYDSRLPLAVRGPNVLGAMSAGQRMGAQANEISHTNALRDLYQKQGADILKGDANALGALAGLDPAGAMDIQAQQQNMSIQREKLDMLRAEGERAAQRLQMEMSAAELEREQENLKRGLAAGITAQSPEQWDAIVTQYGANDLVGQYDNREAVIAFYSGLDSTLDRMKPSASAADQKISRIMNAYDVDYQTATGIADGVLRVSRDPYTDAIQITYLDTDEVWTPSARGEEQSAQPPQAEAQPQADLTFGAPYKGAEDVFGLEGMAKGTANAVTDFLTGQEIFPETAQASRDFQLLREDITQDLQSAYGQRVPSWALQALRDLAPAPGGFQGAGSAQGQLRALGRRFQSELQAAEQSLRGNNRRMSPEAEAEANAKISALRRSMEKINQALGGFEADGGENETSSGVKWRVVQ